MKGLVIWAYSDCRSTMALYREVARMAECPVVITLWHYLDGTNRNNLRTKVGFRSDEFSDVKVVRVGENYESGMRVVDAHPGWKHIFCVYQGSPVYRQLISEVRRRGMSVGVACEAPCNMHSGIARILKQLYMQFILPIKVRSVIRDSDFFISYSGDSAHFARLAGWPSEKVIPFGYFSPPIEGSHFVERKLCHPFVILSTGILSWYRGADILVAALKELKDRNVPYRAVITQNGPLLTPIKNFAERYDLPVTFTGFIPMSKLVELYETCSVYVGTGRSEPWGMRLNDALNCGAPLVVSTGMGGVKMVMDYRCGLSFENMNSTDLADKLEKLATDENLYLECARNARIASLHCNPKNMAAEFLRILKARGWK